MPLAYLTEAVKLNHWNNIQSIQKPVFEVTCIAQFFAK